MINYIDALLKSKVQGISFIKDIRICPTSRVYLNLILPFITLAYEEDNMRTALEILSSVLKSICDEYKNKYDLLDPVCSINMESGAWTLCVGLIEKKEDDKE